METWTRQARSSRRPAASSPSTTSTWAACSAATSTGRSSTAPFAQTSDCCCADWADHRPPARSQRLSKQGGRNRQEDPMPARTGRQFLDGLKEPRDIYVGTEKVTDVAAHPAFKGAAEELAAVFDLQHAKADRCLVPDPETGEPINAGHMIPRSRDDLLKRHAALEVCAEHSVGLMGRTPDYMNVTFAGFAARPDEWSIGGNEAGAENLVAFQKELRRNDLSLTHTIIHPTVDKALGDVPKPGNDVALHKVGETEHGIIVRGSRILATLAPFADEMAVYPAFPLPEGCEAYALSFSIPMTTPGMTILCRDSFSQPKHAYDHP